MLSCSSYLTATTGIIDFTVWTTSKTIFRKFSGTISVEIKRIPAWQPQSLHPSGCEPCWPVSIREVEVSYYESPHLQRSQILEASLDHSLPEVASLFSQA